MRLVMRAAYRVEAWRLAAASRPTARQDIARVPSGHHSRPADRVRRYRPAADRVQAKGKAVAQLAPSC